MKKSTHLPFFVYGTLLPNQPNYSLWQATIVSKESAIFSGGLLYDMGYYPMLIPTQRPADIVKGMVITVDLAEYLAVQQALDNLEGYDPTQPDESAYQRQRVNVLLADGRSQPAWVYVGGRQFVQGRTVVPDGDWAAYAVKNRAALEKWWQTIQSVAGLHEDKRSK